MNLLVTRRSRLEIFPREMIAAFGKDNILFAKSEDMLPGVVQTSGFLEKLGSFVNIKAVGFPKSEWSTFHNCNANPGKDEDCSTKTSAYSIAGGREMLPATRRLIYMHFHEECKILAKEFGVEYPRCLNVLPNNGGVTSDGGDKTVTKMAPAKAAPPAKATPPATATPPAKAAAAKATVAKSDATGKSGGDKSDEKK
jgi:hypothetical protein